MTQITQSAIFELSRARDVGYNRGDGRKITVENQDAYVAKLKAKLDEWNAQLHQLEALAGAAQADKQQVYNEHIATLQQHRDSAQQQLAQLQQASGGAWEDMKHGLEEAWMRIDQAFVKARARFNESKAA